MYQMSPESTGRMNRQIDRRSDLYSLGMTLFELTTGKTAFDRHCDDIMDIIHAHLARQPIFPTMLAISTRSSTSPAASVSSTSSSSFSSSSSSSPSILYQSIILKLLSKQSEDRYQSVNGLLVDLRYCLRWEEKGKFDPNFRLGQTDQYGQFHVSQKLYGREKQVKQLMNSFDRVSYRSASISHTNTNIYRARSNDNIYPSTNLTHRLIHNVNPGPQLLLVRGVSGVGKSALIEEIYKPMIERRGILVRAKFDMYRRGPAVIFQAFHSVITYAITQGGKHVSYYHHTHIQMHIISYQYHIHHIFAFIKAQFL